MEGNAMGTILQATLAFGFIAGILIALADTRLYGVALAVVGVALFAVLLEHPKAATAISDVTKAAAGKLGG